MCLFHKWIVTGEVLDHKKMKVLYEFECIKCGKIKLV